MIYPDTYELGQPNQAVRILCNVVNAVDGMYAERGYLPAADMIQIQHAPRGRSCVFTGELRAAA